MKISVVVPYFQVQPGLLRRAVTSVLGQIGIDSVDVTIWVINDGAPAPATVELAALPEKAGFGIRLLEQSNKGASCARNHALDNLDPGTDYVAFLDSDDYWMPSHLSNAIAAFKCGADFYFCDGRSEGAEISQFEKSDFLHSVAKVALPSGRNIFRIAEDFQMVVFRGSVTTPTVAYRWAKFRQLRFPEGFHRFGEDQFLWATIAASTEFVAVSLECEVTYGRGVSIYSEQTFGTEKSLLRLLDEIAYRKAAQGLPRLSTQGVSLHRSRLRGARMSAAAEVIHNLRRGELRLCARALNGDPNLIFFFPLVALAFINSKRAPSANGAE